MTGGLILERDGQWKDPAGTYRKLKLPTYHHSVPVQELLRDHRWTAFQNGLWGNWPNPAIPEGDMCPPGGATSGQSGSCTGIELPPVRDPESPISRRSASPTLSHSLQPIVLFSDREEAAEGEMELTVPASPPKTAAPRQVPWSTQVAEAITNLQSGDAGQADWGLDVNGYLRPAGQPGQWVHHYSPPIYPGFPGWHPLHLTSHGLQGATTLKPVARTSPGPPGSLSFPLRPQPSDGLRQEPSHAVGLKSWNPWRPWKLPCAKSLVGLRMWLLQA